MKETIYCISGLGADEQIFKNLQLQQYELRYLPWIKPQKNEGIQDYARRMVAPVKELHPIIAGVSFGGVMGIEIAKLLPLKKLFIISSIKSREEMPAWMRWAGSMKLNKVVPVKSYQLTQPIEHHRLGVSTEDEKIMVRRYRRSADPFYIQWAIHEILNWKNDWQPHHLVHIHGDSDRIFPIKKIRATHIIQKGTHMMIYNRAAEVAACMEKELQG